MRVPAVDGPNAGRKDGGSAAGDGRLVIVAGAVELLDWADGDGFLVGVGSGQRCRWLVGVMDGQIWLFFVGSSDERGEL
ncbi:hypothetical protein ACLOJK_027180 [Asimina triloba]